MNHSDPFGLKTYVNCRAVGGKGSRGQAGHCAVRVVDEEMGIDVTIELLQEADTNAIHWRVASDKELEKYDKRRWTLVSTPLGMTEADFDRRVLGMAAARASAVGGDDYNPDGRFNSNRFVFDIITGAGGAVPMRASSGFNFAPGICGGAGLARGDFCVR